MLTAFAVAGVTAGVVLWVRAYRTPPRDDNHRMAAHLRRRYPTEQEAET